MDDEKLAAAIAATQEELGGLFQKPKLSEKLLSKAPFRFLHDIVSAVTAATGFAAGLYSGEELDSGAVKDKASKMAYLDKIVALVGICSGSDIDVRPAKVVAGLEPECTNALLTALGRCAKSATIDFDEAVRRALDGERPGENPPPARSGRGGSNHVGAAPTGRRDSAGAESKSEAKGEDGGRKASVDGVDSHNTGRRGSGESLGRRESRGGGGGSGSDEKASAKRQMEQMGAAAKAMGAPQSRRLSSRAGGPRAEAKSDNRATGGLGEDPSGMDGRDLTDRIEACTGEIAITREMLEPIISRPKLTDKLLNMPPFRFLHDIVSEVTRQTGFGEGLYTEDELDSALVKAKPAKIAYLDKLITLVGTSLNTLVDARPAKIVAGLEAENTNRMLQLLALAAKERPDSTREVAVVLGTEATATTRRTSSEGGDGTDGVDGRRPSEGQQPQQQERQLTRRSSTGSDVMAGGVKGEGRAHGTQEEGLRASSAGEPKADIGGARSLQQQQKQQQQGQQEQQQQQPSDDKAGPAAKNSNIDGPSRDAAEAPPDAADAEEKRSMRPRTARRRPPAVRDKTKDFADTLRASVPDADTKAPPKGVSIMMDGDDGNESDEEELGEVDRATRVPIHGEDVMGGGRGAKQNGGGGHTAMVADILKEKERAENTRARAAEAEAKDRGNGQGGSDTKGGDGGGVGGIRMGRLRGPGSFSNKRTSEPGGKGIPGASGGGGGGYGDADVAKLKEAIQTLCQSTNPLGKCMDFVHEDLSLMSQEMDRWKALYKVKGEALEAERAATEAFLRPLRLQLSDLEEQLKESCMKINGVKANISANEKKIGNLLKMVVTS